MKVYIGFEYGRGGVSSLIRAFQKLYDFKDKRHPSHVFIMFDHWIYETHMFKGVIKRHAIDIDRSRCDIYHVKGLRTETKRNMQMMLEYVLGTKYGAPMIGLMALDRLFNTFFFTKSYGVKSWKVCSQLVAWVFHKVPKYVVANQYLMRVAREDEFCSCSLNYEFGEEWRSVTPDMMQDWCVKEDMFSIE